MSIMLKPIHLQVFFVCGATTEMGLTLVREAARLGARIFMTSEDEEALQLIQDEMSACDYPTAYAVASGLEEDQLILAMDQCMATFGTIDTWVNLSTFSLENQSELHTTFSSSFWTTVNGSVVALELFKKIGGSLINVGCLPFEHASLNPFFSATSEAVHGYTSELKKNALLDKLPVEISFVSADDLVSGAQVIIDNSQSLSLFPKVRRFLPWSKKKAEPEEIRPS